MATIEIDQRIDTPISKYLTKNAQIRYAYRRKLESKDDDDYRGQDYLVVKPEGNRIIFALCDGVATSFFGALGSQILGEALIEWLSYCFDGNTQAYPNIEDISVDLTSYLNKNIRLGQIITERKEIVTRNIYLKNELEERKAKHGTQSNFVCGTVVFPDNQDGEGHLYLFWLGDAKIKIFLGSENKTHILEARWDSNEAWSSIHGVVGEIHHFSCRFSEVDRIIAYSDGVDPVEDRLLPANSSDVLDVLFEKAQDIKDDDISYIEISLNKDIHTDNDELTYRLRKQYETVRLRKFRGTQKTHPVMTPGIEKSPSHKKSGLSSNWAKPRKNKLIPFLFSIIVLTNIIFLGMILNLQKNVSEINNYIQQNIMTTVIYDPAIQVNITVTMPTPTVTFTPTPESTFVPDVVDTTNVATNTVIDESPVPISPTPDG